MKINENSIIISAKIHRKNNVKTALMKNAKPTKMKCFLFLVLLMLLIPLSPKATVLGREESFQDNGLTIINDVIGLDLARYSTNVKSSSINSKIGVTECIVNYNLESNGSKVNMLYSFVDGRLQRITVNKIEGSPKTFEHIPDARQMAKQFLNNYQKYSDNSFYVQLESMLQNVTQNKNLTTISGDVKLESTYSPNSTTFRWTYINNGFEADSKCVVLHYEDGFLKYFINNWNFYPVGSASINLSETEAIDLAINYAKDYSWVVGAGKEEILIDDFNVTQGMIWKNGFYSSFIAETARNDDPLTLYPVQHVWLSLDKFYPGNVYGIEVVLWADTKELCYITPRFSTLDPFTDLPFGNKDDSNQIIDETHDSLSMNLLFVSTFSFFMFSSFLLFRAKKIPNLSVSFSKLAKIKFFGMLLFVCMFLSLLIFPISSVLADNYTSKATIWGSESTAGDVPSYPYNTRKLQAEIQQQQDTAQNITSYFNSNGYDSDNYQGDGSIKEFILANISYNEENYPRVAVVDFDHGNFKDDYPEDNSTIHFMFEDNVGATDLVNPDYDHLVFDMDIFEETSQNKTFFALINACESARITDIGIYDIPDGGGLNGEGYAVGMPFAWTHRQVVNDSEGQTVIDTNVNMTMFGYDDPDEGPHVYLGFPWGSAALTQTINGTGPQYHVWLETVFHYALTYDITVINALDYASQLIYSCDFDQTAIYGGFHAFWPTWQWVEAFQTYAWVDPLSTSDYNSTLAVYGNGDIKLYQPQLNATTRDDDGELVFGTIWIDDEYAGTTTVNERVSNFPANYHTIEAFPGYGYNFENFTIGGNTYTSNPINISITSDTNIIAYFTEDTPPTGEIEVIIDSVPDDGYSRYHALTVDNDIPEVFWTGDWYNQNQDAIIAITGSTLHYETGFNLTEGNHTIEYAVSSASGYEWTATITVEDEVVAQQETNRFNQVTVNITVGSGNPPSQNETIDGWDYRKSHIVNSASGAGTNYQTEIVAHYGSGTDSGKNVYLNSNCQTDFDDIRFTSSDGETLLDYWMEEKIDSDQATFWVEIADNLNSSSSTIYIYYGNSTVSTTSDGEATFGFFDDFEGSSLDSSKWAVKSGSPTVSGSEVYLQATNSYEVIAARSGYDDGLATTKEIRYKWSYDVQEGGHGTGVLLAGSYTNAEGDGGTCDYGSWYEYSGGRIYVAIDSSYSYYSVDDPNVGDDYYSAVTILTTGITYETWGDLSVDATKTGSPSLYSGYTTLISGWDSGCHVDWVFVRKCVATEPSHGSWGSQEST